MAVTTRKRAAEAAPTPRSSKRLKSASAKPSPDTPSSSAKTKQKRPAHQSRRVSSSSRKLSKPESLVPTPAEREKAALTVALSAARAQYSKEVAQLAKGVPLYDAEFYLRDACTFKQRKERAIKTKKADMVVLLAENTLFRLPRPALVKHSELFAGMFEVPPPMNEGAEGRNDERPIILYDMKAEALRWFVRYIQGTCSENPMRPVEQLHVLVFAHRAAAHAAYESASRNLYHSETIRRPPWACKNPHAYDSYLMAFDWQDLMTREYAIEVLDTSLDLGLNVAFFPGALASLVCDEEPLAVKEKAAFMRRDPPSLDVNALASKVGGEHDDETLIESSDGGSDDDVDEASEEDVGKGAQLVRRIERARAMWAYCTRIAGEGVRERGRLGVVIRTVWVPPNRHSSGWEVLCAHP